MPDILYAIGDIHGEFGKLKSLLRRIVSYHESHHKRDEIGLVFLGDYVDRGADSAGVIDWLIFLQALAPERVTCLKGNHEAIMLTANAIEPRSDRQHWLNNGGQETLKSYGNDELRLRRHLEWLASLPTQFEWGPLIFVHAGIDPENVSQTRDADRLWMRKNQFFDDRLWTDPNLNDRFVVHGHTPTEDNKVDVTPSGRRINLDTGACYGGPLSAAALDTDGLITILQSET